MIAFIMLKHCMIKTLLKFIFAIGLVYWLLSSGKLDLSLIGKSIHHGPEWILAILIIITQAFLGAYRYKMIIETKSKAHFSFLKFASLNWIGLFFSSILPGAVTGDIIKLIYIKKHDDSLSKTFLFSSIFIDRILGLTGLLFLTGFFSALYYSEITLLSPKISHIVLVNFFLFAGSICFFFLLMSPVKLRNFIVDTIGKLPLIGKKLHSLFDQIFSLGNHRDVFVKCLLLSIFTQFLNILAFWTVCSPFLNGALPLPYAFTFIPIGLIAVAIPISPAGLGVGHALFQNLFSLVHINNGASLFNLHFLCNLSINILGVVPYLLLGKSKKDEALEKEFSA